MTEVHEALERDLRDWTKCDSGSPRHLQMKHRESKDAVVNQY